MSLRLQTVEPEILVSDYGSNRMMRQSVGSICKQMGVNVVHTDTEEPWSRSVAHNIGIRRATGDAVLCTDVDTIFQPGVCKTALTLLEKYPDAFILSRILDLPKRLTLTDIQLPRDYPKLLRLGRYRRPGTGCCACAPKQWWCKVHGYDERMKLWGGPDSDIEKRARLDGLKLIRLDQLQNELDCKMFHQWHTNSLEQWRSHVKDFDKIRSVSQNIFLHETTIVRNGKIWGGLAREDC
jgi:hypothetical protein